MSYLLDSNICVAYLNGGDENVREQLLALSPEEVHLCSVVKAELLYGARNSAKVELNLRRLKQFFAPFFFIPFEDRAAEQYGLIRAQLKREGTPIGANDLMIAGIAIASNLTLVTRNQDEFHRIAGLEVIAW